MSSDDHKEILARRAFLIKSALACAGASLSLSSIRAQEPEVCLSIPQDIDTDQDGIPDRDDHCPEEPEIYNGIADEDGCPDPQVCLSIVQQPAEIREQIYFAAGSAEIKRSSLPILQDIAAFMQMEAHARLEIAGHTDSQGDSDTNKKLGHKRAKAVCKVLVEQGVALDRLVVVSYGEERPTDTNATAEGRAKNNRVDFDVLY